MKTNWALIAITATFTLVLSINPLSYAFHENLGIDDNKASELYHANPNDPAIVQWISALQSAINGMGKCFTIQEAISCQSLIPTIISNCKSHPNTLLACNDARLAQYPSILAKAEEELKKDYPLRIQKYAVGIIDKCFSNPNSNTTFEVGSSACDSALLSLQRDCQNASSPYNYCKDERFVGYLKQHGIGILNSTVSPYSNLTGNYSSDRPYIGIIGLSLTPDLSKQIGLNQTKGFLLTIITKGSPAEKYGLKGGSIPTTINGSDVNVGGDIIQKIDNKEVTNIQDIMSYVESQKHIGDKVNFTILRDNATRELDLILGNSSGYTLNAIGQSQQELYDQCINVAGKSYCDFLFKR